MIIRSFGPLGLVDKYIPRVPENKDILIHHKTLSVSLSLSLYLYIYIYIYKVLVCLIVPAVVNTSGLAQPRGAGSQLQLLKLGFKVLDRVEIWL